MPTITIYLKPTCTTCRSAYKLLQEAGVNFDTVDYYVEPIPKVKLQELLKKMGIPARALLRTKEPLYADLDLKEKQLSEEEVIDLMIKYPDLIQRPIVEQGAKAILARPPERLNWEIL